MISDNILQAVRKTVCKLSNTGREITTVTVYERLRLDGNRLSRTYIIEVLAYLAETGELRLTSGERRIRVYEVPEDV